MGWGSGQQSCLGARRAGTRSRAGLQPLLAVVGDAVQPRLLKAGASLCADLGAAAFVLVVGGDVADAGVQADRVVLAPCGLQFAREIGRVAQRLEVGPVVLDVTPEAFDVRLIGRRAGPPVP